MGSRTVKRRERWFMGLAIGLSVLAFVGIAEDLARGLDSLTWRRAPATAVVAYYHIEYDPEASHGIDSSIHKSWSGLRLAYTTPEGRHGVATAFDAADLSSIWVYFPRPLAARIEHVLEAGEGLAVFFDPEDPAVAVVQRGIPHMTGAALFLPFTLLAVVLASPRARRRGSPAEGSHREGLTIAVGIVAVVFFAVFALGAPGLWVWLSGSVPPWWVLPGCAVIALGVGVFPAFASNRWVRDLLLLSVPLLFVLGVAGVIVTENEPFGAKWTEEQYVERLSHEHPVVVEYAAMHFLGRPVPAEALDPLRQAVLHNPQSDTRRVAVQVLRRMGAAAVPALPDLRTALTDPVNEEIRTDIESTITTLRNYPSSLENPGE